MKWPTVQINTPTGVVPAIAPLVISASRATDVPAFHADWLMRRLRDGYVKWVNPFNHQVQYVSFENMRAIVFWSKNPAPFLPFLSELDALQISYYFQFTLNDYDDEHLEPHVPHVLERIETFRRLAERIGKHRVIWRFDPLILAVALEPQHLLAKIARLGEQLHAHTTKCVFSFADIDSYAKVSRNLRATGISYREFTTQEMMDVGLEIARLCRTWGITPATCGEEIDLTPCGVGKNKCVDDELLLTITNNDPALVELFGYYPSDSPDLFGVGDHRGRKTNKDPGQRKQCACVLSKDIGRYNTCPHLCVYCYANTSSQT